MSKVYFGSVQHGQATAFASFAAKVDKVIERLDLSTIKQNEKVAIKMHLGFSDGYQTIPVFFVRRIVQKVGVTKIKGLCKKGKIKDRKGNVKDKYYNEYAARQSEEREWTEDFPRPKEFQ